MRLKKLKLAGFKSFVDPTTIAFPGQLVAIVGPNGCGKSNTIDAVRWVMGESSAKHLRGESMTDVIFNGSTARKPVGQAHVELIFDNSDGSLGGEFAQFAEISVKRLVSRDGQSNYYLNGTKCRRRDIIDIILGTGVGPRSYAIIEQGMISRLIEAKPEELRIYLEEVAGIAKYKERRKETETRIKHTRENLERLEDLREELNNQLEHLAKQAKTAERYKQLKEEESTKDAQLKALRFRQYAADSIAEKERCQRESVVLEERIAKLRKLENELETQRQQHSELVDELQDAQAAFYQQGTEVNRIQQQMQHYRERATQLQNDVQSLEQQLEEAREQLSADQERLALLKDEIDMAEPTFAELTEIHEEKQSLLQGAETELRDWQRQWDKFQQESAERAKACDVERTRIEHLDKHLNEQKLRVERLLLDKQSLAFDSLRTSIEHHQEEEQCLHEQVVEREEELATCLEEIKSQRQHNEQANTELAAVRKQSQGLRGKIASLEALQQAALGKHNDKLNTWLEKLNIASSARLAQEMQVEAGWELAVETVLGQTLQAICVDKFDTVASQLTAQEAFNLTLLGHKQASIAPSDSLQSKLNTAWDLSGLCGEVLCVDTLEVALQRRSELQAQQSFITPDGFWVGPNWLRVKRQEDEQAGTLARERLLRSAEGELATCEAKEIELHQQYELGRERLQTIEHQREELQRAVNELKKSHHQVKATLLTKQNQFQQLTQRAEQIDSEISECHEQMEEEAEVVKEARALLATLIEQMATDTESRETLQQQKNHFAELVDSARHEMTTIKERFLTQKTRMQSLGAQYKLSEEAVSRVKRQVEQYQERFATSEQQLQHIDGEMPNLQIALDDALEIRLEEEERLRRVRESVESLSMSLHECETGRSELDNQIQQSRQALEQHRLRLQTAEVRRTTIEEEFAEITIDLQEVLSTLPEDADEQLMAQELTSLANRIQRLGAINLAAIEEYATQSERKTYLDSQAKDLNEALETLESAIQKIDRETRSRFKETYDTVNGHLKDLFPKVFGGGEAYLELTGEDLLETGVSIIARPPGKKNSTIHLLSGGEKALTAIALVFSLFKLNPAPFCMLDEVDAPLDDANVRRFSRMVQEMSSTVQFIFITHNKVTMEMADHLMGVTMREPGVSRIVSVDVEEATALANA